MIHWTLTEAQADQIVNTLAQRPFAEVTNLIQELLRQANDKTPQAIAMPGPKPNGAAEVAA